jgi:hypothetical protein
MKILEDLIEDMVSGTDKRQIARFVRMEKAHLSIRQEEGDSKTYDFESPSK